MSSPKFVEVYPDLANRQIRIQLAKKPETFSKSLSNFLRSGVSNKVKLAPEEVDLDPDRRLFVDLIKRNKIEIEYENLDNDKILLIMTLSEKKDLKLWFTIILRAIVNYTQFLTQEMPFIEKLVSEDNFLQVHPFENPLEVSVVGQTSFLEDS